MQLQVQLEEHSYPIYIEHHALDRIKNYLDPNRKYAIVTDDGQIGRASCRERVLRLV